MIRPKFEDRAILQRATAPGRTFALASLIAVVVGLGISFLFGLADPGYHSVQSFAIGGLIGLSINAWNLLGQLLVFRLVRPRTRWVALACRFVPFFFGGGLGVMTGALVIGRTGVGAAGTLNLEQIAGFGAISLAIGAVYELIETLKSRLRASVAQAKEQEFAERELRAARSLQQRLLPRNETAGHGYRIAARNLPSLVVSGDFYDVFAVGSGRIGFAVGDVAGKGMAAGLIMASVKAMLPLLATEHGVADTLRAINRRLFESLESRQFVALCLGCFDPAERRLVLANSGLPDAYRIGSGDDSPATLSVPGPRLPLGLRADVPYEELAVTLDEGDRIFVTTDGLPESLTPSGEPLGYEALEELLNLAPVEPPLAWIDELFRSVRAQTSEIADDDWTALVLEVRARR